MQLQGQDHCEDVLLYQWRHAANAGEGDGADSDHAEVGGLSPARTQSPAARQARGTQAGVRRLLRGGRTREVAENAADHEEELSRDNEERQLEEEREELQ